MPEEQLRDCSKAIRAEATGSGLEPEIDDGIAAILVSAFVCRTGAEICAMGGITVADLTSSVADGGIFGLGRQEGCQDDREAVTAALALRQLQHRCGSITSSQPARIEALFPSALEALADALLAFQGQEDLQGWLSRHAS